MGLRFNQRIKLGPGMRLNLGLRSASVSIGGRAGRVSVGTRGATATADLPGTGLSYQTNIGRRRRRAKHRTGSVLLGLLGMYVLGYVILYMFGIV